MTTIATCEHPISGEYFQSLRGHVSVKTLDWEGRRAVKWVILCERCLDQAREEELVLSSDAARFDWLNGSGATGAVW